MTRLTLKSILIKEYRTSNVEPLFSTGSTGSMKSLACSYVRIVPSTGGLNIDADTSRYDATSFEKLIPNLDGSAAEFFDKFCQSAVSLK